MTNNKLNIGLMSALALLLIFNQFQIVSLHTLMTSGADVPLAQASDQPTASMPGNNTKPSVNLAALAKQILPTGIPPVYGAELGVSFDNAAAAINVLAPYEQDTRGVKFTGEKLSRYVDIGQRTSCEFCCGATTMVFPDGSKACGCAHSAAMRGVVAYLLDNTDMTDNQILAGANKWKAVFFPGPMVQKVAAANGLIGSPAQGQGLQQQVGGC